MKNEAYLLELATYIHLNPVLSGLVPMPEAWEYSSYREFIGTLPQPELILSQFTNQEAYRLYVNDRLQKKPDLPEDLFMD